MPYAIQPGDALKEIVQWVCSYYLDDKGGLARTIMANGQPGKSRLFNDLGDYLPFFAYLGEKDFCEQQLEDTRKYLQADGLLPPEFRYLSLPCTRSYEHTDLLLGLIDVYHDLPSEQLKQDILRVAEAVRRTFHPKTGHLSSWHFPSIGFRFPILDFKDGMFIEIWTLLYKEFGDPSFLQTAEQLAAETIEITKQESTHLVPNVVGTTGLGRLFARGYFGEQRRTYTPIKYISNTVYGMLELYRETKNETYRRFLEDACADIQRHLIGADGAVHIATGTNTGLKQETSAKLVQNFPIIDWAADCAYFLKDERFLALAERVAAPWLAAQHPVTGLIPQELGGTTTDLDNLTDTSIAFTKLYELTGKQEYQDASDRIVNGILTYHREPQRHGYVLSVKTDGSGVADPELKVKFICLFLKTLIVKDLTKPIFGTELYDLTKDR